MGHFSGFVLPVLVGVLLICAGVQWAFIIGLNRRLTRQTKMLRQFFSGPNGEDLEALLTRNLTESREALLNSQVALAHAEEVGNRLSGCIQHFALMRYDAFEDVTGQQSFSLALLDGRDNGSIISAVFGRHNSRCFGKMIVDGQPEQPLTQEEKQVLMQALEQKVAGKKGAKPQKNGTNGTHKIPLKPFVQNSNSAGIHNQPVKAGAENHLNPLVEEKNKSRLAA